MKKFVLQRDTHIVDDWINASSRLFTNQCTFTCTLRFKTNRSIGST